MARPRHSGFRMAFPCRTTEETRSVQQPRTPVGPGRRSCPMLGYAALSPVRLDMRGTEVSNPAERRSPTRGEPNPKMYDVREIVTGGLGIAIVAFTLAMTGIAFSMAGEGARMRDAITVLTLLFGLAGVVVGYYFGRVPAEKRADTATKAMDIAMQGRKDIINQADEIHNDMQRGMDKAGLDPSMLQDPNLTKDSVTPEQWEQIKKILAQAHSGISKMATSKS